MNKVKKFGILAVALLVSVQFAGAATLTGTPDRVAANNSGWSKKFWDQSTYPSPASRHGTIIRVYDFSLDGGAVGTISLERDNASSVLTNIPDNTIILGGFIDVISPVLPATTSTNSLGIVAATDLLGVGTNLTVTGLHPILAGNGTNAAIQNIVKLTADAPLNFTVTGAAITQGFFMVYLDAYYGQ